MLDESLERGEPTGPADEAAVQADDIIFGASRAFRIEHIERIAQIGEELVAGIEALAVAKRMSLASSV